MKKILILILGPLNIIPLFFLQLSLFGRYSGHDIGHLQNIPLILQGSTDWGGSNQYATYLSLYISLGIFATFYLYLCLSDKSEYSTFKLIKYGIFYLCFHIISFLFASLSFLHPDERNMTLLFTIIYIITFFIVLRIVKKHNNWKYPFFAPILIYIFVFLAWDGSSPKAGQILNCYEDPSWNPRSQRHNIILKWHKFGDRLFSYIGMNNDR